MKLYLEKNLLSIDNYKQIINISNDLIILEEISVKGNNLKILSLDPYKIVIMGEIFLIKFGEDNNAIQNIDEQK